ncbi:T9SS type A sorting domain-containing protein [Dyadobacter subterraneus]|uniref:T9SS type A sorting domain-containing protein n=1 Tax=Dyadobacter subterraneus TaxID=2773304 RepID=A0ABR9W6G3_9BACT|nr:T9SS type A sorting domain-containing protein [Dyadobacter subterraneus]MBE9461013.1 T9SS type A sorting domain-containing protein [Dyadobacter subterraneus]
MKLLQKLFYVCAFFALVAATPYDSLQSNRVAAVQVSCGGRIWTDGELLGEDNHEKVWTVIFENRVYIRKENNPAKVHNNNQVLYNVYKDGIRVFPPDQATNLVNSCVNEEDPSTISNGYLQPQVGNVIRCNNKPITDKLFLGDYIGGDRVISRQYARIINGRLRVNLQREGNAVNFDGLSMALIHQTIDGENGSYLNPNMGFTLNHEEINSCFWKNEPLPATLITATPACTSGPILQGISNITKTSLRFSFSGTNIPNVTWRIKSGGTVVRNGTTGALSGATIADLTFASLDMGSYTLEIEGGDCTSSVSTQPFTVTAPACTGGPTISSVTNIGATGLTVNFAGTNITSLNWTIRNNTGVSLASGKTGTLTSNSATLAFGNIVNGTYTLQIQGGDCVSTVSAQNFNININCNRGPVVSEVANVTNTSLSFQFDGDGVYVINWRIMQGNDLVTESSVSPQNARPTINYTNLANGNYTLQIQGGSCNSAVSSKAFALGVPLPIEVSNFTATPVSKGIDLSWKVLSEKNGEGFEIIRFNDSKLNASQTIGKVALTEQKIGDYSFLDENPEPGINYYQLKQIDFDGTFEKSRIISAKFDLLSEAFISPNPAVDFVNVQFTSKTSGNSGIELYNMAGIKLSTSTINVTPGQNSYKMNVGKLGQGYYFVKVLHGDQNTPLRFIKVN